MLNTEKFTSLVLAIAQHPTVNDLGITKLWKLIFFVEAATLRELGHSITNTEFVKYEHGPVPSRGEKLLKKMKVDGILAIIPRNIGTFRMNEVIPIVTPSSPLPSQEQAIVDHICTLHGAKTAKQLSDLSHQEPAWIYANMLGKLKPTLIAYGTAEDPDGL